MKNIKLAAFVVLIALGTTSVLQALPNGGTGFEDTFYSDSSFSDAVGGHYMECNGYPDSWGTRTEWVQSYQWDCQTYSTIPDPCPSNLHHCESGTYIHGYMCECV